MKVLEKKTKQNNSPAIWISEFQDSQGYTISVREGGEEREREGEGGEKREGERKGGTEEERESGRREERNR